MAEVRGNREASVREPDPVIALDCFERPEEAIAADGNGALPSHDARGRRRVVGNHCHGPPESPPLASGVESAERRKRGVEQDGDADDQKEVSCHDAY